jgi:hypothetical protein
MLTVKLQISICQIDPIIIDSFSPHIHYVYEADHEEWTNHSSI